MTTSSRRNSRTASSSSRAVGRPNGASSSGRVVGAGAARAATQASGARSSIRSHSCSATRRPVAARSTERDRAGAMHGRLGHAADAPQEGPVDEPPVQAIAVDGSAAGPLVGPDQLVEGSEAGDLGGLPESPSAQAEPRQVLVGVAEPDQLPVDDRRQALRVDDDVAEPEVAVDDGRSCGVGPVLDEPVETPCRTRRCGRRTPRSGRACRRACRARRCRRPVSDRACAVRPGTRRAR